MVARLDGDVVSRSPGEPGGGFTLAIVGRGALEISLLEAGVLDLGPVELDAASGETALLCDEAAAEEALCREEGRLRCDASADAISDCLLAENNQCRNYLTAMIGCFAMEDPCPQVRSGLVACTAELPLRAGPISLVPGLAAGAGWTSVSRGGACDGCLLVDDGFLRDVVDPRIEVHLGAGWPLSTVLAAELWLGCNFNPSGGASIAPAYARALGDAGREALSLPGPPRLLARAGLGLRVLP